MGQQLECRVTEQTVRDIPAGGSTEMVANLDRQDFN